MLILQGKQERKKSAGDNEYFIIISLLQRINITQKYLETSQFVVLQHLPNVKTFLIVVVHQRQ